MKKYIIIALATFAMWSCKQEDPVNYVLLSGKIGNTKGGELTINNMLNGYSKTINVKDDGVFVDTLFIKENGQYEFRYEMGRIHPYLSIGDQICMQVGDAKEFLSTISFEGDYSEFNNFIALSDREDFDFRVDQKETYNVGEAAFETRIQTFKDGLEKKLNEVSKIPEGYKARQKRAIEIKRLRLKSIYEIIYARLTENDNFKASDAFKKEYIELDMANTEDYLCSADYRDMVFFNLMDKVRELDPKDAQAYRDAAKKVRSEIKSEVIRNTELFRSIKDGLYRKENKEEAVDEFLSASSNEGHKAAVLELFEELKALDAGQPSPQFVNYENYDGSTTSLNDLKGKYVYIDVWATWCGPCKAQIPHLKKVEEKYHGKNITFLSISTDKQEDKQKWKDMIKEKELGGVQLITDNDFNTSFISGYKISGIPRFILLDPDGNIVSANAPRPSEEKLIELFDSLNI